MSLMPDSNAFSRLYSRLGRYSRYAGLGFVALSIILLVLSVYDQFIVFEIDSIAAFLIAVVLLFRDPRARVQVAVVDAILNSAEESIEALSAFSDINFTYVPNGTSVEGVVVIAEGPKRSHRTNGSNPGSSSRELKPPGRGLATLFVRETGLNPITMDLLQALLPDVVRERFSLATSTEIVTADDTVEVTLRGASATCSCGSRTERPSPKGSIGCPVASFVAVLVSAATNRSLTLKPCAHDSASGTWKIIMSLGAGVPPSVAPSVPPKVPEAAPVPITVSR